jgi:hypothetical protein
MTDHLYDIDQLDRELAWLPRIHNLLPDEASSHLINVKRGYSAQRPHGYGERGSNAQSDHCDQGMPHQCRDTRQVFDSSRLETQSPPARHTALSPFPNAALFRCQVIGNTIANVSRVIENASPRPYKLTFPVIRNQGCKGLCQISECLYLVIIRPVLLSGIQKAPGFSAVTKLARDTPSSSTPSKSGLSS